ncbi:MAG TPA: hypothetical protein VNM67_13925 [Thermoanaerobaculia bacterium]|jgi:hypothetical protein|nr:hypothetical protein [Thermoanaerobaculia bacterium]
MKARTTLAIVCALLLGGAMAAQAQGRITVTKMYISSCEEMGSCELRLTCESGGKEVEMVAAAIATNPDTLPINKTVEVAKYPATVSCTLFEDDGWFGETWDEAAKGSVSLTGGGDYELKLTNPEQASVVLTLLADSMESTLTAPSAAVPAGGKVIKAAPRQFLAIFRKETEPKGHAVVLGQEWPAFQKKAQELAGSGVHPIDVETWVDGGKRLWGGIFRSGVDASEITVGQEWEPFMEQWTKHTDNEDSDKQMQLIDMEIYVEKGKTLFVGVYRNGTEMHSLWVGQDRGDFLRKWQQLVNQQLRLIDLEIYKPAGGSRNLYAGVFIEAPGSYGIWNATTWEQFQEKRAAGGSGLWDVETYMEDGKRLYDGVVLGGGGSEELPGMLDGPALVAKWRDMLGKGYRMIHLEPVE